MSSRFFLVAAGFLIVLGVSARAQDAVDENTLFADSALITQAPLRADSALLKNPSQLKSTGISGTVTSAASGSCDRDFFNDCTYRHTALATWITGDLNLDVRLTGGVKAFTSVEATYRPVTTETTAGNDSNIAFSLPEFFVDANYRNRIYVRSGKQVLQWGRCYFWNPTDLINIEQKQFIQKIGLRQGTYGVKLHAPFGSRYNVYGFAGTYQARRPDEVSGAVKFEFLVGGTEMAVSAWGKRHYDAVYGFDASSRLLGVDINGELGLHRRYRLRTISFTTGDTAVQFKPWTPRACLGLSRSFQVGEIKDRLSTVLELYYNQVGSTDRTINLPQNPAFLAALPGGYSFADFLVAKGYYQPNNYSRYYAAFFGSLAEFIIPDITLTVNAIANLNQGCAILTTGLSYTTLNDFSLGFSINSYLGPDNTEYTLQNNGLQVQATIGVAF